MARGLARGGGGDGIDDKDAKHLLDSIGKIVYDQVKNDEAKKYIKELEACVSFATFSGVETAGFSDPCGLIKDKRENLIRARGHPCGNVSGNDGTGNDDLKRFSKERVSKYDEKKIGCSNSEGACAPYRRLSLCNKNFQKINNDDSTNAKHNLLLDVCMAANYEA
ncbi:hypothetical protein PFTANZ_06564, partial [Plasmodium falciparum Tanzania (2000708)]